MALLQSIDHAGEDRIGRHGVAAAALTDALGRTADALAWLRKAHAHGTLPLLRLPAEHGDVRAIADAAKTLAAGATDIVLLGTGGSSLGGQTLAQLGGHGVPGLGALRKGPRPHFMDNPDPETFASLLSLLPLPTPRLVAISKSGGTAETLMQTAAVIDALKRAGLEGGIPELLLGLSEPAKAGKRNGLRDLLDAHKVKLLDHDPNVGGRFSVLTNVALLPAAIMGLDVDPIRAGAAEALKPILSNAKPADVPAAVGAALAVALAETRAKSIAVLMAYADRLERMTRWYVQLWAESLGKDGKGTTPIGALGPVDQHSQLQLYIAGPRDKLFTVVTVGAAGRGPRVDAALAARAGEADLGGRTIRALAPAQPP